jgi:ATP-dependent RNA helicase HelY
VAGLGFGLDPFQVKALDALDNGHSVLVAAPTGSGKTVVAEYAVARALAEGGKAFYTTPLKALSNQKFGDLVRRHGADRVGLLTGDNAINGGAPVVVMTTEVLRNMIYAQSPTLSGLRYVILDEVHYLENAWRGPVWEEVIIHTPADVDLVCLSATVSNAEEFADWITTVRGSAEAIIEERRPVDLHHLYLLGDRGSEALVLLPTFVDGRPNPSAAELDERWSRAPGPGSSGSRPGSGGSGGSGSRRRSRPRYYTPRRAEVVDVLHEHSMLPAIYFIFSRAACDDAVRFGLADGLRLTTPEERAQIRVIAESKVESLSDADLRVLDYGRWLAGLEAGIAAHHAGMVPPFKEAVEACFAAGLLKVVFATETLSLGINMPARTVVIEKLTKFTGERHEFLKAGEYTQLTGRAGRRGIDEVGYAVVLWSPFVAFEQVAGLASKRAYALTSAFRPTYNMAVNLVRRYPAAQAHHLLNLSFAQYRADGDVVRLETQLERARRMVADIRTHAHCDRGDIDEYRRLASLAADASRVRPAHRAEVEAALERIKPGDILVVPGRPSGGRVAVISTARRRGGEIRLGVVTVDTNRLTLTARDFPAPPRPVARVELPSPFQPNSKRFVIDAAAELRAAQLRADGLVGLSPVSRTSPASGALGASPASRPERGGGGGGGGGRVADALAYALAAEAHPVKNCPDLRLHLRAAERADRIEADANRLERTIRGRTESLARQFDRVLRVLEAWGYVDGWALTASGERLSRVYHECDLLVAETLGSGLLDGLDPASVAGLVSTFTYEQRGPAGSGPAPWFPSRRVRERWASIERLAADVNRAEQEAGLPQTRQPDAGFVALAYAWAAGEGLEDVIADAEMSGGDFVRNIKQLIDLLRQIGDLAPDPATASAARRAADNVFRGVVSASSVITVDPALPGDVAAPAGAPAAVAAPGALGAPAAGSGHGGGSGDGGGPAGEFARTRTHPGPPAEGDSVTR